MTKRKVVWPMSSQYYISTRLIDHEYYLGCVKYYDGDQYLYSEWTKINRPNEEDAKYDAVRLAEDHFGKLV